MNLKKINIWDLGSKINIKVRREFINLINVEITATFRTKRNVHKELVKNYCLPFSTFANRMKRGYNFFIDLEILFHLCKILQISLNQLQSNVVAYKVRKGSNCIENPKLPIEITPVFDMLVAHHIGDGTVINPKKNRKPYFGYRQFDHQYRNLYLQKIESVFGKVNYKDDYCKDEKTTRIYFPVAVSSLMFQVYNLHIDSFKSEIARIPTEIFDKDWKYQLAFLLGIIIDEGHVDSSLILIRMKNKEFVEDLSRLCSNLSYSCSLRKGKEGMYCLYILSKSISRFYEDYQILLREFPEADLGWKGQKVSEIIQRSNKPKIYLQGNKNRIIKILEENELTINELAKILNITRQGARYLVQELSKEGKVSIVSSSKYGASRYGLKVQIC